MLHDDKETCIKEQTTTHLQLKEKENGQIPCYSFNRIFSSFVSQQEIYEHVGEALVDNLWRGVNGTLVLYGETGSGKSYTFFGNQRQNEENEGVFPRIIDECFQRVDSMPKKIQCKIQISMIEIFNEVITDLINFPKSKLQIRCDKLGTAFIENMQKVEIHSKNQINKLIDKCRKLMNSNFGTFCRTPSEKNFILFLFLEQRNLETGEIIKSKITGVELAGSETAYNAQKEKGKVNVGFTALSKVIKTLGDNKKVYVPYRESKLTRVLQEGLGGNSVTKLIININPTMENFKETERALRFGVRVKEIKNYPRINKEFTFEETKNLLEKEKKKNQILSKVMKLIMKEKGKEDLSLKEFLNEYLNNEESELFGSEYSVSKSLSRVKSIPSKFTMRSQSPSQKINPELGMLRSDYLIPNLKKSRSSNIKLNKSSEMGSNILSVCPQKHTKKKSYQFDHKSIDIKITSFLGSEQSSNVEDEFFEERIEELNFMSQNGDTERKRKSEIFSYREPSYTCSSKVIDFCYAREKCQEKLKSYVESSELKLPKIPVFKPQTTEQRLSEIRANFRRICSLSGTKIRIEE